MKKYSYYLGFFLLGLLAGYVIFSGSNSAIEGAAQSFNMGETNVPKNGLVSSVLNNLVSNKTPDLRHLTPEVANGLLQQLTPSEKYSHLAKLLGEKNTALIDNPEEFINHAVNDYLSNPPINAQQTTGQIVFNLSSNSGQIDDIRSIKLRDKVYAHLKLQGPTLNNGLVFIKWLKRDTGETLLFTVKEITASSADNWVSFIPDNGWAPGEYEVRYYRFQSNLEPLAVNRYTIIGIQPNN